MPTITPPTATRHRVLKPFIALAIVTALAPLSHALIVQNALLTNAGLTQTGSFQGNITDENVTTGEVLIPILDQLDDRPGIFITRSDINYMEFDLSAISVPDGHQLVSATIFFGNSGPNPLIKVRGTPFANIILEAYQPEGSIFAADSDNDTRNDADNIMLDLLQTIELDRLEFGPDDLPSFTSDDLEFDTFEFDTFSWNVTDYLKSILALGGNNAAFLTRAEHDFQTDRNFVRVELDNTTDNIQPFIRFEFEEITEAVPEPTSLALFTALGLLTRRRNSHQ